MILSRKRSEEGKNCAIHHLAQPARTLERKEREKKELERALKVRPRQLRVMELVMAVLSKTRAAFKKLWLSNRLQEEK